MDKKLNDRDAFFADGIFDWQFGGKKHYRQMYSDTGYDEKKYWGGFAKDLPDVSVPLPDWAIGPFDKYEHNPIFSPSATGWDRGRFGGGVHNGAIIRKDGQFFYVYRGEEELSATFWDDANPESTNLGSIDYICDIGIAVSDDGINFRRATQHSPLFRHGKDAKYSFEDVCLVTYEDQYYLYCNRWDWKDVNNPNTNGVFIAISRDMFHWENVGLAFSKAKRIHRNACVVQNPINEAVRVNGRFVMHINDGLIAYSDNLIEWQSHEVENSWPGGEGCFAVAEYSASQPDHIVLFTGGHHTGHFYAVGEVLVSKENPERPLA